MAVTIREHLVSAADPGAVGANKLWVDTTTTPYVLKIRDGANAAWVVVIITAADLADLTDGGATTLHSHASGSGDVVGPASAVDNNLTAFDGITGKLVKDSGVLTSDAASAVSLKHARSHAITGTSDHTSTATPGQMLKADASGLPIDATNTDAAVAAAVTASAGVVPVGGIIMWSGTIATIPANWALCDGAGGTPDLRDKFIVGATSDDAGAAKTNLTGALTVSGGTVSHHHADHSAISAHSGAAVGTSAAGSSHDHAHSHAAGTLTSPTSAAGSSHTHTAGAVSVSVSGITIGASGAGSSHSHSHSHSANTYTSPTSGADAAHTHSHTHTVGTSAVTPTTHSTGGAHTHDAHTASGSTTASTGAFKAPLTHASQGGHTHDNHGLTWGPATDATTGSSHTHTGGTITGTSGTDATAEAAHTHAAGAITEPNAGTGHSHSGTGNVGAEATHTHAGGAVTGSSASDSTAESTHTHAAGAITQPSDHSGISAHDTLSAPQPYFALAFIMRTA